VTPWCLSAVSDIYRIVVPLSLRAKRKRRSDNSERCNLENKSTTSLRRGANLSRRETHWHPWRLGPSATSPRRPETSLKVFFPHNFNILHWSNTYSQVIIFLASVPEVPFYNPGWCDVTRLEGFRVFYNSQSINHIVRSLLYLSPVDCHLLSPPLLSPYFTHLIAPKNGGSSVGRHTDVGMSVYFADLVVAIFTLGWPQAESLQSEFRWSANLVVVRQESCSNSVCCSKPQRISCD
jgi:hypothetical protein